MKDYLDNLQHEKSKEDKSFLLREKFLTKFIPLLFVGILLYIFLTKGVIIALYTTGLFIIGYFILSLLYRMIVRARIKTDKAQ